MELITVEKIKQYVTKSHFLALKYVRVNGEYRFCVAAIHGFTHRSMVQEGEQAETAAFVQVGHDGFYVEGSSLTLDLAWDNQDISNFAKLFGVKEKDRD